MPVKKRLLSFAFLFIAFIHCNAQQTENPILWVNNIKLTWDDFKGNYDTVIYNRQFEANTNWSLRYKFRVSSQTGLTIEVSAFFIPNASWVRDGSRRKEPLLRHEQLHFDLAELFARKLRKFLTDKTFSRANCKEELHGYFAIFLDQLKVTQHTYDEETNHGRKKEVQADWEEAIYKQIKELSDFSSVTVNPGLTNR